MPTFDAAPLPAATQGAEATCLSEVDRSAVYLGLMDGEATLVRAQRWGFFTLFIRERPRQLASQKLEALRTYAEMARVVSPKQVPLTSLVQAGVTQGQIGELLRIITVRVARHATVAEPTPA